MKSFEQLSEDIEARRAALKQRQREQGTSFKERGAGSQEVSRQRMAAQRTHLTNIQQRQKAAKAEREQARAERENIAKERQDAKDELRQELEQEKQERMRDKDRKRMSKERAQAED